ncbi:S8 family serine peptidase [Streptomyces sp. NPDC001262]|uniref:S8 family peptidase n=1 Tax=Streptomyces sp. NPDC001262 TaxID=3364552 RepID=UPI0036A964C7
MPQDVSTAHAAVIRQAEWPLDTRHLNADAIWHITEGQGVTVAVIDSGVQADHPDLTGQVVPGVGFLGDSHDRGQADISGDSHGTAIAGIIAGTGAANGGYGMIGLAPKAKILPVRVTVHATVEPTALAQGITYAADHHAQVINVSLGMPTPDPVLRRAIDYAIGKDAVIVASAGNNGRSGDPTLYPAAFPGVVDVTGVNSAGRFWPVSESGPRTTLAAPAIGIYSTNNRGQYVDAEGTSYAAAYVSAAAALVRSAAPPPDRRANHPPPDHHRRSTRPPRRQRSRRPVRLRHAQRPGRAPLHRAAGEHGQPPAVGQPLGLSLKLAPHCHSRYHRRSPRSRCRRSRSPASSAPDCAPDRQRIDPHCPQGRRAGKETRQQEPGKEKTCETNGLVRPVAPIRPQHILVALPEDPCL